jgi:hypothetical protein
MNLKDFDLDSVEIITIRSIKTSKVIINFVYEDIEIQACSTCHRSLESEISLQCEILAALGFSDQQTRALSYE